MHESPEGKTKQETKIKNEHNPLKIKGESILQIPSPKIPVIIAIEKKSSKSSLNLNPFSLIVLPAIMDKKQIKVDKTLTKIRFSTYIFWVELPIKIKPSIETKLNIVNSKKDLTLNFL